MVKYCVYKITGKDGIEYIGHTKNIKNRIQKHKLNKSKFPNRLVSKIVINNNNVEILLSRDTDNESIRKIENAFIQLSKYKDCCKNLNMRKAYKDKKELNQDQKLLMRKRRENLTYRNTEKTNRKRIYDFSKGMDNLNKIKI